MNPMAKESTSTLADRIKYLRKTLHLTQKDMAKSVGITPGAVSLVEIGRSEFSKKRWRKLAPYTV